MTENQTAIAPISVVVASKVGAPFIGFCLASLDAGQRIGAEVIVAGGGARGYVDPGSRRAYPVRPRSPVERRSRRCRPCGASGVAARARRGRSPSSKNTARPPGLARARARCARRAALRRGWWTRRATTATRGCATGSSISSSTTRLAARPRARPRDLNDANIAYPRALLSSTSRLLDDGYWPMTLHPTLLGKGITLSLRARHGGAPPRPVQLRLLPRPTVSVQSRLRRCPRTEAVRWCAGWLTSCSRRWCRS